jgi:hypothetical protein
MKLVFAGPSLYGAQFDPGDVIVRGPAEMGDLERAVAAGVTSVGIIDGHYQQVGAVWHKEILFALAAGVAVYGAASMGALRVAECEPFGMIPIGDIANRYCSGELVDDADVALTNGPAELGFPPLTEAMVDVEATAAHLHAAGHVAPETAASIVNSARAIFFADRTIEAIFAPLGPDLLALYQTHRIGQKTADALALIETLKALPSGAVRTPIRDWRFVSSPFWTERDTPRSSAVTPL